MNTKIQKLLLNRMNRLIGHAESNKRMIENEAYCFDIIDQNMAVIAAIHKLNAELLRNHLQTCVRDAMKSGSTKRQAKVIEEVLKIYHKSQK